MNHSAKLIASLVSILLFVQVNAFAKAYKNLGQRVTKCPGTQADAFRVMIDESLKAQTQSMWENDRLEQVLIADPQCFRVGTEVQLFLSNEEINFLGRAFVKQVKTYTKSSLLKLKSLPYSKNSIKSLVKNNPNKTFGLMDIRVTEKVEETTLAEQYDRLPTCFPSYGDWRTFRVSEAEAKDLVPAIQKGKKKGMIWNGTFNCYKVGIRANIVVRDTEGKKAKDPQGSIIPNEVALVHYSNLSRAHARKVGESLKALRERLKEKKDTDGGYLTMVTFDYEKPQPKEEENPQEDEETETL